MSLEGMLLPFFLFFFFFLSFCRRRLRFLYINEKTVFMICVCFLFYGKVASLCNRRTGQEANTFVWRAILLISLAEAYAFIRTHLEGISLEDQCLACFISSGVYYFF